MAKKVRKLFNLQKRKIISITSFYTQKSKKILTTSKCEATCSTSDQSTSIVLSENEVTTNINESHQHTPVSTQVIQDELICKEGSDQTTQPKKICSGFTVVTTYGIYSNFPFQLLKDLPLVIFLNGVLHQKIGLQIVTNYCHVI